MEEGKLVNILNNNEPDLSAKAKNSTLVIFRS